MKTLYLSIIVVLLLAVIWSSKAYAEDSTITVKHVGPDQLYNPAGLAINHEGDIYVSDYGSHSILKFDQNGKFLSKFGTYGSDAGQLNDPTGIAVDGQDNIYVVDQGNGRIEKFSPSGKFLMQFGSPGGAQGQLDLPIGIVVDVSGNIYVGDLDNSRIQKFDPSGVYLQQFPASGSISGMRYLPSYLSIDNSSDIYALDDANNVIQKFDASGGLKMQFKVSNGTRTFYSAWGVAVDKTGNIYVSTSGQVLKFDQSGRFLDSIGTQGTADGQMDQSQGIAIDNAGNIYVADSGNRRIDKFDSSGRFLLSFGTSNQTAITTNQVPPIIISQVELYGPPTNRTICDTNAFQLKEPQTLPVWQWIELYNPTETTIQTEGYDLSITHQSQKNINLEVKADDPGIKFGPHEGCVYALVNPDGPVIDDPRNVIISFGYRYNNTEYAITTPPLTDTYNDSRTWQLVGSNWTLLAPSPYQQVQSGVKADEVVCNQGLVLMARLGHNPVCIKSLDVTRVQSLGWSEMTRPDYIPVIDQIYGSGPGYSCRFIFPHIAITNSSGFSVYNDSGIIHYGLSNGNNGTITYAVSGPSYGLEPSIYSPNKINVTNGAYLYYNSSPEMTASETNSLFGVTISYQPTSEIIPYNGSATITATISASSDAKQGKYGINFVPGGCAGPSFVKLDVGSNLR